MDTSGVTFNPPNLAWRSTPLDGQVYGEPLEATGRVFVATENDTIYALAADTGAVLWSDHLGTPVPSGDLPCGDITPRSASPARRSSTSARGEIFAVADVLSNGAPSHVLVGLNIYTGATLLAQAVDPPGQDPARHPPAHRAEPQRRQRRLRLRRQRRGLLDLQRLGGLGARGRWDARLLPGGADRPRRGRLDGRGGTRGGRQRQHLGGHRERVLVDALRLQRLGPRAVTGPGPHAVLRAGIVAVRQRARPGPRVDGARPALERDRPAGRQVLHRLPPQPGIAGRVGSRACRRSGRAAATPTAGTPSRGPWSTCPATAGSRRSRRARSASAVAARSSGAAWPPDHRRWAGVVHRRGHPLRARPGQRAEGPAGLDRRPGQPLPDAVGR